MRKLQEFSISRERWETRYCFHRLRDTKNYVSRTGERSGLKNDLQRQLHVECFARPNARSAVEVANGVGSDAESAAVAAAGRRQVDAVEEVIHFDAELRADPLGDLGVLDDREVSRGVTRSIVAVARAGPKCSGSRVRESGLIEPSHTSLAELRGDTGEGIADLVRALFTFTGPGSVVRW